MNKEEFKKLFGIYKMEDTITIWELYDILVVPEDPDPKVENFLDSRVLEYEFPKDTKKHRQISAMVKNKLLHRFGPHITFRDLLETGYFPEGMKKESQIGIGCIKLLGDIYTSNKIIDIWKYKKTK